MSDRKLDLICIGRAAVNLYGDQVGGRLEDMLSCSKYLGGCVVMPASGMGTAGAREHRCLAGEGVCVLRMRQ